MLTYWVREYRGAEIRDRLKFPAEIRFHAEARSYVQALLSEYSVGRPAYDRITLALDEALSIALGAPREARDSPIELLIHLRPGGVRLRLRHRADLCRWAGLGMRLMRAMMDHVGYRDLANGSGELEMIKRLPCRIPPGDSSPPRGGSATTPAANLVGV